MAFNADNYGYTNPAAHPHEDLPSIRDGQPMPTVYPANPSYQTTAQHDGQQPNDFGRAPAQVPYNSAYSNVGPIPERREIAPAYSHDYLVTSWNTQGEQQLERSPEYYRQVGVPLWHEIRLTRV